MYSRDQLRQMARVALGYVAIDSEDYRWPLLLQKLMDRTGLDAFAVVAKIKELAR